MILYGLKVLHSRVCNKVEGKDLKDVTCLWIPNQSRDINIYALFQSEFLRCDEEDNIILKVFGCNFYRVYLDGIELINGPARFEKNHPEFDEYCTTINKGKHVLKILVHYFGVETRYSNNDIQPFIWCTVSSSTNQFDLKWKCKELSAFKHIGQRISSLHGWMEYCDTRILPDLEVDKKELEWKDPVQVNIEFGDFKPKLIRDCLNIPTDSTIIANGEFSNRFGYIDDDPPVRFIMRDLQPVLPPEGVWFRFDLEKIGLYQPCITLDVPCCTVVEAGYSDQLTEGRVHPYISLSLSASCNMDRWIAKGGKQTFKTFSPRGFRYMEIHIEASSDQIKLFQVIGIQRTYFGEPAGIFKCSDELLNRIWKASVDTLRACCEDALVDTPVRERGQWVGDQVVGMEVMSVAFGDLSLIQRSLFQATYCRRQDGMVPALYPSQMLYIPSFSLLWIIGCTRYYNITGDKMFLSQIYDTAVKTINVFLKRLSPRGISKLDAWDFIDWGFIIGEKDINVPLDLLFLGALKDLKCIELEIGELNNVTERDEQIDYFTNLVKYTYFTSDGLIADSVSSYILLDGDSNRCELQNGFHATVFGLWLNLIDNKAKAVEFIKHHILDCFPNDMNAPRLAHPSANHSRLITPYFSHFSLQVLLEAGEIKFVLDQYRICWGWMLEQGATTLFEVFDPRWSSCHAFSSCPAWQMTEYILGITPDGYHRYRLDINSGDLLWAEGTIPIVDQDGCIKIEWIKQDKMLIYKIECSYHVEIVISDKLIYECAETQGLNVKGNIIELSAGVQVKIVVSQYA